MKKPLAVVPQLPCLEEGPPPGIGVPKEVTEGLSTRTEAARGGCGHPRYRRKVCTDPHPWATAESRAVC